MRACEKRKAWKRALKQAARDGKMNNEAGHMVNRNSCKESSMRRDYSPQGRG